MNRAAFPTCRLHNYSLQSLRLLIWLAVISLAQPFAALAQTNAPAPLPAAAQEAVNKGIIAAKVPDYLLAIRYFEEARMLAPQAPVIYLNLGLAESKIPGRELRAIAWFGAYLAAYPDAPNAAVVKEQIDVMDVKNQSTVLRLLKAVEDAVSQIPGDRSGDLTDVAKLWAEAGEIAAAVKTAGLIKSFYRDEALKAIAEAQLKTSDIVGAQSTLTDIDRASDKFAVQIAIIQAQMSAGDVAGARKALALAQETAAVVSGSVHSIAEAQTAIAAIQTKLGDSAGAQTSFSNARKSVDSLITDTTQKTKALTLIGEAQLKAGDIAGGQSTLAVAQITADLIQNGFDKKSAHRTIAEIYVQFGDIGRAQKAVELFPEPWAASKWTVYKAIAEHQARRRDISGALKTADLHHGEKSYIQTAIAAVQIQGRDIAGANTTLALARKNAELIDDMKHKAYVQTAIAAVQIQGGDIAGANTTLALARKNAELIDDMQSKSYALTHLAEALAKTGDMAGARATLNLARQAADLIPLEPPRTFSSADSNRLNARSFIARASAKLGVANPKTIAWLDALDSGNTLNTAPFLDFAGHLKSLPQSNKPYEIFNDLKSTAKEIVKARNGIQQLLKAQIGK